LFFFFRFITEEPAILAGAIAALLVMLCPQNLLLPEAESGGGMPLIAEYPALGRNHQVNYDYKIPIHYFTDVSTDYLEAINSIYYSIRLLQWISPSSYIDVKEEVRDADQQTQFTTKKMLKPYYPEEYAILQLCTPMESSHLQQVILQNSSYFLLLLPCLRIYSQMKQHEKWKTILHSFNIQCKEQEYLLQIIDIFADYWKILVVDTTASSVSSSSSLSSSSSAASSELLKKMEDLVIPYHEVFPLARKIDHRETYIISEDDGSEEYEVRSGVSKKAKSKPSTTTRNRNIKKTVSSFTDALSPEVMELVASERNQSSCSSQQKVVNEVKKSTTRVRRRSSSLRRKAKSTLSVKPSVKNDDDEQEEEDSEESYSSSDKEETLFKSNESDEDYTLLRKRVRKSVGGVSPDPIIVPSAKPVPRSILPSMIGLATKSSSTSSPAAQRSSLSASSDAASSLPVTLLIETRMSTGSTNILATDTGFSHDSAIWSKVENQFNQFSAMHERFYSKFFLFQKLDSLSASSSSSSSSSNIQERIDQLFDELKDINIESEYETVEEYVKAATVLLKELDMLSEEYTKLTRRKIIYYENKKQCVKWKENLHKIIQECDELII
jgi:hypothetical protein